jgi:hypothetical protein
MAKNDFTAQAGISLEQWKKDIATMTESMGQVAKASEKTSGILSRIANTAIISGAIKLFTDFGSALLQTGRKAGQIDSEFTALYGHINAAGDAGLSTGDKIKAALLQVPKLVGLKNFATKELEDMYEIASVIDEQNGSYDQMIAKIAKLSNLRSTETAKPQSEQRDTNLERINGAIAMTSMLAAKSMDKISNAQKDISAGQGKRLKDLELENNYKSKLSQLDASMKDAAGNRSQEQQKAYGAAVTLAKTEYDLAKRQNELQEVTAESEHDLARSTAKLRLDGVEGQVQGAREALDTAKKQEDVAKGVTAETARAAKTKTALAYAELDVQERNMSLSQIQTTQSEDDADARKEIYTLELNSAKNAQKAAEAKRDLFKVGSIAFRQAQVEVDLAKRREEVALFALANSKMEIANAINLTEVQMSGTARVAAIEQNRVQFANQIAKALHEGDEELANQLGKQQAINDLQAEANELLKSPAQKAKEAKEQRKNEAALRVAAARDKMRGAAMAEEDKKLADDNRIAKAHGMAEKMFKGEDADAINKERADKGLPPLETINRGGTRSGTRGSEATRKAIKDAAERNAPKNVGAAQNQINEFVAKTLIVTAVKSK